MRWFFREFLVTEVAGEKGGTIGPTSADRDMGQSTHVCYHRRVIGAQGVAWRLSLYPGLSFSEVL